MRKGDLQLFSPGTLYKNTYSNITALSPAIGSIAYATDTDQFLIYGSSGWGVVGSGAGGGDVLYSQVYDAGERMSDYVSYVDITGGYEYIEWIACGAAVAASRYKPAIQFGGSSIDTGANYIYYCRDSYSATSTASGTFIDLFRTGWPWNNTTNNGVLTAWIGGFAAGAKHVIHGNSVARNDRYYGYGYGEWVDSGSLTKLLTDISDFSSGWTVDSFELIIGYSS